MEMQLNVARYYSHENKHIYSEPTVRNIILLNVPNVLGRSVLVCKCAAAGYAIWKR